MTLSSKFSVEGPPLFYFAEPIQIVDDLGDGWVLTEWSDGRRWRQWRAQLHIAPLTKPTPPGTADAPRRRRGTLALSWGAWGGFYFNRGFCPRVCLGWLAITYCPVELDDMMEAYANG